MNQKKMLDALIKGAVLRANHATREAKVAAMDDLPPEVRECIRASRDLDDEHWRRCPGCLESEAHNVLMDATSHREDGNDAIALELEAEAGELLERAARLRGGDKPESPTL